MKVLKRLLTNFMSAFISIFYKRDKRIVLFGAWHGDKFADNSRYLFQFLSENKESLGLTHVVWVTRNRELNEQIRKLGYESYMMDSLEAIYYHKKAKIHIVCDNGYSNGKVKGDIEGQYSYGAKRINLWHGIGIKGVNFASNAMKKKLKNHPILMPCYYSLYKHFSLIRKVAGIGGWTDCLFLGTTECYNSMLKQYFLLPSSNIIPNSNYPRNCKCPKLLDSERKIINRIQDSDYTVLYLPTFRNSSTYNFDIYGEVESIFKGRSLFIQKPHSSSVKWESQSIASNNLISLPTEFDINVIMPYIDVLITDYSSCATDALYHEKGVIFFVPDYDIYLKEDRGFVIDPELLMCAGVKAFSIGELCFLLESARDDIHTIKPQIYYAAKERFWGNEKTLDEIWRDIVTSI